MYVCSSFVLVALFCLSISHPFYLSNSFPRGFALEAHHLFILASLWSAQVGSMGGSQGNQRGLTFMLCVAKKLIAWTGILPARILVVCVGIRKIVPLPVIGQMIVCNLKRRAKVSTYYTAPGGIWKSNDDGSSSVHSPSCSSVPRLESEYALIIVVEERERTRPES